MLNRRGMRGFDVIEGLVGTFKGQNRSNDFGFLKDVKYVGIGLRFFI